MNAKQRRTLLAVFRQPPPASLRWSDIVSLFGALGATIEQGRGSRLRVSLNGHDAVFHAPHPERDAGPGRIRAVRDYLEKAGIQP